MSNFIEVSYTANSSNDLEWALISMAMDVDFN